MNRRELAERALAGDTHAGVELARLELARGRPGRPRMAFDAARARAMLAEGRVRREVAAAFGISMRTLDRRLDE